MHLSNLNDAKYIKSVLLKIKKQKTIEEMFEVWANEVNEYKFDEFIPRPLACRYFKKNGYELYLRFSVRKVESEFRRCLDIANIYISEQLRNRGWFKRFISRAMRVPGIDGVYIESVNSKILREALSRWRFIAIDETDMNYFLAVSDYLKLQHHEL